MTCLCNQYQIAGEGQSCQCDTFVHPEPLQIAAGLDRIPRQLATFPEYRRAMLADVRTQVALDDWRAREKDDLGVMLLEMWAYVCDNLSFYDEVIAQEAYIRTAMRRPSMRRLVDLLGYLPIPAVAASAEVAAFSDGRQEVTLPVGTAFRSGGFDEEGPQVFEVTQEAVIHPLTNKWSVEAPHPGEILAANPTSLLIEPTAEIAEGTRLLIIDSNTSSHSQVKVVKSVAPHIGQDEQNYTKVEFTSALTLAVGTSLEGLKLFVASQTAGIEDTPGTGSSVLLLDKQYRMTTGQYVLISRGDYNRWFKLNQIIEKFKAASSASEITINGSTFDLTPIQVPATQIVLDRGLNDASRKDEDSSTWFKSTLPQLSLHYNMTPAGKVVDEAKTTLDNTDTPLQLKGIIETPLSGYTPTTYLFEDKNKEGLKVEGEVKYDDKELTLGQGQTADWQTPLTLPVEIYGNVIKVVRGESVSNEILGSGDASLANQAFKLKKKPLTYLSSPTADNDQGVENTLTLYVDNVMWKEVASFFGTTEEDQVYIVRQDDEGESIITFGDGERGQRVPTGKDNVIASYRFGAGEASPPAGSITQIAKPAKGLKSVKNPLAAYGGSDAESTDDMRSYAPKSILTLGRAVSMQDMEAITRAIPGVRMVQSEWRWDGRMQQPVVKIWYIGDAQLKTTISKRLHSVTDPSTPIQVVQASPVVVDMSIDVSIDSRYLEEPVVAAIFELLMTEKTGLLLPEQLAIGKPLFRSVIFGAVLDIEGVECVQNILWNGSVFCDFAQSPGAGQYFDFEGGNLLINGNSQEQ